MICGATLPTAFADSKTFREFIFFIQKNMNQIMLNLINKLCAKCPKEYVDEAFAEFTLQMNEALAA